MVIDVVGIVLVSVVVVVAVVVVVVVVVVGVVHGCGVNNSLSTMPSSFRSLLLVQ